MYRIILTFTVLLLLSSCKTVYQTAPFNDTPVPTAPDYADERYWAVLPGQYPKQLEEITGPYQPKAADVFFVYPTLLVDKRNPAWNADVHQKDIRQAVLDQSVKYQASAFAAAGNLYVPFYRQSHYKVYVAPHDQSEEVSRAIAYADVRSAFAYYLAHYNQGRPIILASHSQGSIMMGMLLKEFFDGQSLQEQLVAAYVPGIKIKAADLKVLRPMTSPTATGGYLAWNTVKQNHYPSSYERWYKGGVTSNPILWNERPTASAESHLGVLNSDGKIYPQALSIELVDGLVWSSLPKIPKRWLLSLIKSYHFADINLFWKDIEKNAQVRVEAWLKKNPN